MKTTSRALLACASLLLALAPARLLAQCLEFEVPASPDFVHMPDSYPYTAQEYFHFENNSGETQFVDVRLSQVSGPTDWVISMCRGLDFCLPLLSFNNYTVEISDSVMTGEAEYYDILIVVSEESFGTAEYELEITPQGCPEEGIDWDVSITVTDEVSVTARPRELRLGQNWPNPFNPATRIPFELRSAGAVSLEVFDISGRRVASPLEQVFYPAGSHSLLFDAGELASGVYLYTVRTPFGEQSNRMILAR